MLQLLTPFISAKARGHDAEENVRWEAVLSIVAAAKKDFKCVPDDILEIIKERTLDKRFKIRKEALQGLGKGGFEISLHTEE